MKLLLSRNEQNIIAVYATVTGDIIYSDTLNGGDCNSDNIFSYIDKDSFLRLSLYNNRLSLLKSTMAGYSNVIVNITGNGIAKRAEMYFISDYCFDTISNSRIKRLFSVRDRLSNSISAIELDKYLDATVDIIKERCPSIQISKRCDRLSVNTDPDLLNLIFAVAVSAFYRFESKKQIDIELSEIENGARISVITTTDSTDCIKGIYSFCEQYPNLSSLLIFLKSVCDENGIEAIFEQNGKQIYANFIITSGEIKEFSVLANTPPIDYEIIDILFE